VHGVVCPASASSSCTARLARGRDRAPAPPPPPPRRTTSPADSRGASDTRYYRDRKRVEPACRGAAAVIRSRDSRPWFFDFRATMIVCPLSGALVNLLPVYLVTTALPRFRSGTSTRPRSFR